AAQPALADAHATATPIKHVVVIFQENVSFDHYFATYPHAANPAGEPPFTPRSGTPSVNGLTRNLLTHNPNSANPERLDRSEALTCDQDHHYGDEQRAFDGGLMDKFVEHTNNENCTPPEVSKPNLVMDYYDGNTVTALWNYAQHFAMSDNAYNTTFGPSTPGALNLVAGQTHGAISTEPATDTYGVVSPDANGVGTVINDPDPTYDDCSNPDYPHVSMVDGNRNIGDLLSARGISWGWFEGGFRPTSRTADGKAVCGARHRNIGGNWMQDYIPHHEPFQYYKSTSNPHHLPPSSVAAIGHDGDQANHQYDLKDFWSAVDAGTMPAVSFLKAAGYQDGHAGYSDPLDEQTFLVKTINRLEKSPQWKNTAVIIAYDDSDGWYDHQMGPIVSQSSDPMNDALTNGSCGANAGGGYMDRCGYGPRLPLLVISPWARENYVDHSVTDQASVLRFIEDNWQVGRIGDGSFDARAGTLDNMLDFAHRPEHVRRLFLDPATGLRVHGRRGGGRDGDRS
ncbi:MAG TPA: alkaline phosphatase family protein, partial [Gammaproteobacteria bacterium]|nr:alkaline phosphatase family protein [Gammaproteobacteria bacterium]